MKEMEEKTKAVPKTALRIAVKNQPSSPRPLKTSMNKLALGWQNKTTSKTRQIPTKER